MSFYYLHINGNLIWKKFEPESDSSFVKKVWPVDETDRACGWTIILESLALGAKLDRIKELCSKWKCDQEDFEELVFRVKPSDLMIDGAEIYIEEILNFGERD